MKKGNILVVNGPVLSVLGLRNPELYGTITLEELKKSLEKSAAIHGYELVHESSNHEGKIIDHILSFSRYAQPKKGIIINPGGLAHTSVILRDALAFAQFLGIPSIEVHISDIHNREEFRKFSYLSAQPPVCAAQICGRGIVGYEDALNRLVPLIEASTQK